MVSKERLKITKDLLLEMGIQLAEMPVSAEKANSHCEAFAPLMEQIVVLRDLPLKELEPAMVFSPVTITDGNTDD